MRTIRKERISPEEINRKKIELLEKELESAKTLAITSGAVASLSTVLIASSLAFGDVLQAIQTGGTAVAMASYVYGYHKGKKLINEEINLRKETNSLGSVKKSLEILKIELAKLNNTKGMATAACSGFLINALAHLAELIMFQEQAGYASSIISIFLSGTVAILDGWLIMLQNNRIALKESEIQAFQELSNLEDKYINNNSAEVEPIENTLEEGSQALLLEPPKGITK